MMQSSEMFLGWILVLLGGLGALAGLLLLRFPAAVRAGLAAFPRSKWPGWILTAACLFWVSWVIRHAALGRFEGLKPLIPVVAVLVFAGMVWLLDELLAPRALGGLLLLVANPILNGVRWTDSAWRFVPVLVAYAWVVAGCVLMLHPWSFRKLAERFASSDAGLRRAGLAKLLAGAVLLAAGLFRLR